MAIQEAIPKTIGARRTARRWQRFATLAVISLAVLALAACSGKRPVGKPTPVALAPSATSPTAASRPSTPPSTATLTATPSPSPTPTVTPTPTPTQIHPLSIEYMRQQSYPGSEIVVEQALAPGSNYNRYIVSYLSEGLKQYALLTVPRGQAPETGWPVIVFNHGYIPPRQYRTTERYVAYVDSLARNGYIVLKPDYRGHGDSEGNPSGAYGSNAYVTDVLNAVASIKRYPGADPNRIGMWGHSMGGWITLRAMVASSDVKAGVIWGGVVGAYEDLLTRWRRGRPGQPTPTPGPGAVYGRSRFGFLGQYGSPETNPSFWSAISANYFLDDLSGPIQLHHAEGDNEVPVAFSQILYEQGQEAGMPIDLVTYPGDNHNISGNFGTAMDRTVAFFDRWLKQPIALAGTQSPTLFSGAGRANLRSGPGASFDVVGQMQPGDSLPIIGSNVDRTWWQVQTPDGPVWVSSSVSLAARFASVPVVDEAAGP